MIQVRTSTWKDLDAIDNMVHWMTEESVEDFFIGYDDEGFKDEDEVVWERPRAHDVSDEWYSEAEGKYLTNYETIVAIMNDTIVGMMAGRVYDDHLHVKVTYVLRNKRYMGVASALEQRMTKIATTHGCKSIRLEAPRFKMLDEFWGKLGYWITDKDNRNYIMEKEIV